MDKKLILNRIKVEKKFSTDTELASFLGISKAVLSNWYKRDTIDYDLVLSKCELMEFNWLIKGTEIPLALKSSTIGDGIPLIPTHAMAGYMTGEVQTLDYECERYVVPMFKDADFLISVKGSSMIPKYNSGDIVACKKLPLSDIFFQWNKVYVLDTAQGVMVKRIKKGSDTNSILIVSDNIAYEPFELQITQLHGIAIVIGVIRLE
jgi:SOS-response transcriptional repressor LexA